MFPLIVQDWFLGTESKGCLNTHLRGNVGENQRSAPTCQPNICSYSGHQKFLVFFFLGGGEVGVIPKEGWA